MRTRQNLQILETRVWAGGVKPRSYTTCPGVIYNDTRSFGSQAVNSKIREERISDSLGKGQSHAVVHRLHTRQLDSRPAMDFVSPAANVPGTFGVERTTGTNPYWDLFQTAINTSLAWSVSNSTSLPPMWSFDMSMVNESVLINDVLDRAKQLKADLLLDVVEANQIWPSIRDLATSLPQMALNWRDIRKVVKTASNGYLAWKFGVSPILSDMMAVQRYMPRMKADILRHAKGDSIRVSRVAEFPIVFSPPAHVPFIMNGYDVTGDYYWGTVVKPPQLRYVLVVKPNMKYMTSFFQKADSFMSRFATSPASLAWEKIPFSFVVDWFVDLRSVLNAVDKLVGVSPYQVVSFTRSLGYEVQTGQEFEYRSPCTGGSLLRFGLGYASCRHYERSLASAQGPSLEWKPRFGKNQAGISAALIAQRLFRSTGSNR